MNMFDAIFVAVAVATYLVLCATIAVTYVLGVLWSRDIKPGKRKERKRKGRG